MASAEGGGQADSDQSAAQQRGTSVVSEAERRSGADDPDAWLYSKATPKFLEARKRLPGRSTKLSETSEDAFRWRFTSARYQRNGFI